MVVQRCLVWQVILLYPRMSTEICFVRSEKSIWSWQAWKLFEAGSHKSYLYLHLCAQDSLLWLLYIRLMFTQLLTCIDKARFGQLQHYSILRIQNLKLGQLLLHIQHSSVDSNPVGQLNAFLCSSTLIAEILYHESDLGSSFSPIFPCSLERKSLKTV